jgi:hypothetical protein
VEFVKIVLLSIGAAIFYGIVHDLFTAHLCVEYFSVAHPMIFPLTSPTAFALEWGILATWWVGAALGLALATCARLGSRPTLRARDLIRPIAFLLLCMAIASLLAAMLGFTLAKTHRIWLTGWLTAAVPAEKHARFLADAWAHSAAYLVAGLGGILLCRLVYLKRKVPSVS